MGQFDFILLDFIRPNPFLAGFLIALEWEEILVNVCVFFMQIFCLAVLRFSRINFYFSSDNHLLIFEWIFLLSLRI